MGGDAPRPGAAERVLLGPWGLRAGWRILLFLALVYLLTLVLAAAGSAAGVRMEGTAGFVLLLVAVLAAGSTMMALVERRAPGALGFQLDRHAFRESVAGTGFGAGLIAAVVVLLVVTGGARWVADEGTVPEYVAVLVSTFAFFAVAAAWEEAVFRGYAFQALVQGTGAGPAVVVSSALFAAVHAANPNVAPLGLANIFLAGVLLAVVYLRTRSLWFATGVHLGWNWTMATVLDLPVSGFESDTPLYSARISGPELWTGGAFGPEAGIPATLVLAGAVVWTARTRRLAPAPTMRARRPLVDDRLPEEER